eukprot:gene10655-22241_t
MTTSTIAFSLLGHKGKCFDVRKSSNSDWIISASEDGTARLWSLEKRRTISTFTHNTSSEVLRASFLDSENFVVCTCGSDGNAKIWKSQCGAINSNGTPKFSTIATLPHGDTQIYACESLETTKMLTAAENELYIWDISNEFQSIEKRSYQSIQSGIKSSDTSSTKIFGGPRNPDMLAYIFDAKIAPQTSISTGILSIALSDGTVRLVDTRMNHDNGSYDVIIPITSPGMFDN